MSVPLFLYISNPLALLILLCFPERILNLQRELYSVEIAILVVANTLVVMIVESEMILLCNLPFGASHISHFIDMESLVEIVLHLY